MKKEYLREIEELIEIAEQLKNLEDLYAIEVDRAREALGKNELGENELEYKSVQTMCFFIEKLNKKLNNLTTNLKEIK